MDLYKVSKYFYPHKILDIGANKGQFHTLAKSYYKDAYIFSIEANENCEQYLKKITNDYYIGLLAKNNIEYNFYCTRNNPTCTGNSIYKELTPHYAEHNLDIIKKNGIKLDDLFAPDMVFDLIKIDTQGSELDIIEGGITLCKKAKGILLEVSLTQFNENSPLYDDVVEFMESINFGAKEILNETIVPNVVHQQDILFIRKWL